MKPFATLRDAVAYGVVIRTHGRAASELYFALEGKVEELHRVGDAVAVRYVDRAVFDGHLAGRAV